MRRAILISAHFLPSNLAGVQRVRLLALRLREFGWQPVVVTVDARHYEEANDEASLALLPPALQVERVGAWTAQICRPLGFGDVSLRGQWAMRRKVQELVARNKVDLIFATVLPGYTSLVGAWAKRKFGLPFVLDYQDPWVSDWGARQARFSKAGLSHWLATKLEPRAVVAADALTAVSDKTLDTLRERNLIKPGLPVEIIPIGADVNDHAVAARLGRSRIQKSGVSGPSSVVGGQAQSDLHLAYIGTIIEGMLSSVRTLFRAVRALRDEGPARRVQVHFIGTSAQPEGRDLLGLERLASELGVGDLFQLEPRRIGYLDALRTMQEADALLLLGSQDPHYTASKIFPCWLSGKPVLALFHKASTVNDLAHQFGGVRVVTYNESAGAELKLEGVKAVLRDLLECGSTAVPPRNEPAFEPFSARGVARQYAVLFDRVAAPI